MVEETLEKLIGRQGPVGSKSAAIVRFRRSQTIKPHARTDVLKLFPPIHVLDLRICEPSFVIDAQSYEDSSGTMKNTGVESEIDIFLVFRNLDSSERFALRIENKLANGKFENNRPWLYHKSSVDWMTQGTYQNFATILIAARSFYERCKDEADIFHRFISHEDAAFIQQFA